MPIRTRAVRSSEFFTCGLGFRFPFGFANTDHCTHALPEVGSQSRRNTTTPPQAQLLANAKPRRETAPCQKAMPRKRNFPIVTDDLARAQRTSPASGTSTTTLVPRFVPVAFADQQFLAPVNLKTPRGTSPSLFRALPVVLIVHKSDVTPCLTDLTELIVS